MALSNNIKPRKNNRNIKPAVNCLESFMPDALLQIAARARSEQIIEELRKEIHIKMWTTIKIINNGISHEY